MKIDLKDKIKFAKYWGNKCKEYSPLCACCSAWLAFDSLRDLYDLSGHYKALKNEDTN